MNSEERYNRWVDGLLAGSDTGPVPPELAREGIAGGERAEVRRVGELLRHHAPALEHPDVFREQILDRIRREQGRVNAPETRRGWSLPRLAWSGFGLVALAVLGFAALIPKPWHHPPASEIYGVWSEADRVSAVALRTPDHSASVVWLDGLDYLPADHAVQ